MVLTIVEICWNDGWTFECMKLLHSNDGWNYGVGHVVFHVLMCSTNRCQSRGSMRQFCSCFFRVVNYHQPSLTIYHPPIFPWLIPGFPRFFYRFSMVSPCLNHHPPTWTTRHDHSLPLGQGWQMFDLAQGTEDRPKEQILQPTAWSVGGNCRNWVWVRILCGWYMVEYIRLLCGWYVLAISCRLQLWFWFIVVIFHGTSLYVVSIWLHNYIVHWWFMSSLPCMCDWWARHPSHKKDWFVINDS